MQLVHRDFAQRLLAEPALSEFWQELGRRIELPDSFQFLYEPDVGLFVVEPVSDYYGLHVAIFPQCRGRLGLKAGQNAVQWVLQRAPKALARVRRDQSKTCFYAAHCGMKRYAQDATHIYYEASLCH